MLVLRILGTLILVANVVLHIAVINMTKDMTEEHSLKKIYLILNTACLIFMIVLMWVL